MFFASFVVNSGQRLFHGGEDRVARLRQRLPRPGTARQPVAAAPNYSLEYETNRYGSDYNNFDVPANDPAVCQNACMQAPECVAWTLVRPGIQGPNARCWLKNRVPPPTHDTCCTSGMK